HFGSLACAGGYTVHKSATQSLARSRTRVSARYAKGMSVNTTLPVRATGENAKKDKKTMSTTAAPNEDQVSEFQTVLGEIKDSWAEIKPLPASLKSLQSDTAELQQQFKDVRRL